MKKIAVGLAEDSKFFRTKIAEKLNENWRTEVSFTAGSPAELEKHLREDECEVLLISATFTADIPLYVGKLINHREIPIVVLTQDIAEQKARTIVCLENGAVNDAVKPSDTTDVKAMDHFSGDLVRIVKEASSSRLATYRKGLRAVASSDICLVPPAHDMGKPKLIAFGASTGGPAVLTKILNDLSPSLPVPVVVIQHMVADFLSIFARELGNRVPMPVYLTKNRGILMPGTINVASGGEHLTIHAQEGEMRALHRPRTGNDLHCPSINVAFNSLANLFAGNVLAVLLTGMGDDGAQGLRSIANLGGITIAEDRSTALIYGMPAVAVALGAAKHVLPSYDIAKFINSVYRIKK